MKKMISILICLAMVMAMTMAAMPFAVLAAEDSGSIQVEAEYRGSGAYENYVKNYTFTAEKDGEYIFSVPAGLGVWDMIGFLMGDESQHYVDYATNTSGATFTLEMKAGESFRFYVGTNSASVTSGTITWTIAAPPSPDFGTIQVEAHYSGSGFYDNYTSKYTFTALEAGEFTFVVSAGLGVWEQISYLFGDPSGLYVDHTTNTAGATFTLTLAAGQSINFYVAPNSPDVTSGTITWTRNGGNAPEQPSADQLAANAVIDQIGTIGTVTLDSKMVIENARAAYEALTDAQKALVTNYDVLAKAEADLKELEDQAAAEQPEQPTNPENPDAPSSGSIQVEATYLGTAPNVNYVNNYTFTAEKSGEYTFFVPAGFGVWEIRGWLFGDESVIYVHYTTNTEGASFTRTMAAGDIFTFVVGTNSPDLTSGTITWTVGAAEQPEQPTDPEQPANPDAGSIQVEAAYVGTAPNANFVKNYTFTAEKDGEYTFFVPAGLGVWELRGWLFEDESVLFVNYTTNTDGATFTRTMAAGDIFTFVVGTNSPDLTSGTITWTIGGAEQPDTPAEPETPVEPEQPDTPAEPETPVEPEKPEEPVQEALVITVGDRTFTADGGKWLYNTEFTKADTAKYKMIVLDKNFTGTFETNEYGAAIVLNKYGELVKIYDGANIGFWTVEGKAATTTITKANFASLAFSELEEGEMMIIFPNDGVNAADSARSFALGLRNAGKDMPSECGKLCTLTGFTFENKPVEPETPVEPEQPDTPVEPEKPDEPIAPTGDYTFVVFAMMVLSMTAIVVLVSKKRAF